MDLESSSFAPTSSERSDRWANRGDNWDAMMEGMSYLKNATESLYTVDEIPDNEGLKDIADHMNDALEMYTDDFPAE